MKYLEILKWVGVQIRRNPATTVALFSITFNVMLVYYLITKESKQDVQLLNCQMQLKGCQESKDQQRDFYQDDMKERYRQLSAERDSAWSIISRLTDKQ